MWTKYVPILGLFTAVRALVKVSNSRKEASKRYVEAVMICLGNPRDQAVFEISEAIYREADGMRSALADARANFGTAMIFTGLGVAAFGLLILSYVLGR